MTNSTIFRRFISIDWAGLLLILLLASVAMTLISPKFVSTYKQYIVWRDVSVTLLVGLSQLVVLAVGHMNLSLGAIGGLVVVITGGLMEVYHLPIGVAVLAGIALGAICGIINGVIITQTGIHSFIVTIATSEVFLGINNILTEARPFYNLPQAFKDFGQARSGFFPHLAIVTIAVTILMAIFVNRTVPGRQILAVGGNLNASETSGIPVKRVLVSAHVLSGVIAAIAGILLMSRLGAAQPTIGELWLLPSFAVPIIGGVALTGGSVTIMGTVLAAFLIAIIQDALVLLNVNPLHVQFLLGLLILGAVGFNRLSRRGEI